MVLHLVPDFGNIAAICSPAAIGIFAWGCTAHVKTMRQMKPAGPFVLPSVPVIRPLHNPACAMSGPSGRWSERPIQRLDEDGAGAALVERNGIAAGGRILRRHRGDAVDLRTVDAETRQGVRDAGAAAGGRG